MTNSQINYNKYSLEELLTSKSCLNIMLGRGFITPLQYLIREARINKFIHRFHVQDF